MIPAATIIVASEEADKAISALRMRPTMAAEAAMGIWYAGIPGIRFIAVSDEGNKTISALRMTPVMAAEAAEGP